MCSPLYPALDNYLHSNWSIMPQIELKTLRRNKQLQTTASKSESWLLRNGFFNKYQRGKKQIRIHRVTGQIVKLYHFL